MAGRRRIHLGFFCLITFVLELCSFFLNSFFQLYVVNFFTFQFTRNGIVFN